jgi:hypothetical protein
VVLVGSALGAGASDLVTVEEALDLAFPGAAVTRETLFLTDSQMAAVEARTGERPPSALTTRYRAETAGGITGWAYLDTHRVRTLPETLIVIVGPDGTIVSIEVVSFREPLDYLPPESWYRQFDGRRLDDELDLKRGIRPITGATLTARSTTDAARRVLSIHSVLEDDGGDP